MLAGAAGKPLAALIVGKQNFTSDLNGLRGVYVRKPHAAGLAAQAPSSCRSPRRLGHRTVVNVGDKIQRLQFEPVGAPA